MLLIDLIRNEPRLIQIYTRIAHRLPSDHITRNDILNKIDMMRAGYNGECQVDHFLKQVNFPGRYAILKEVNLKGENQSFISIDTMIITPSYICILEIKTIKGTITFQSNPPQLLREVDGVITPFKCPEQQLTRHMKRLGIWLERYDISLPIVGFIVLPYSKTRVILPPKLAKIVMGCDICSYIEELNENQPIISREKFDELKRILRTGQTYFMPAPLATIYTIDYNRIRKGLMCSQCLSVITNEKKCSICKTSTRHCKKEAIEDWFHLWKETISNRECLDFVGLKDDFAASYLLRSLPLLPEGKGRSRRYRWKPKN